MSAGTSVVRPPGAGGRSVPRTKPGAPARLEPAREAQDPMATDHSTSLSCSLARLLRSAYRPTRTRSDAMNPVRRYHVALTLQETTSEADRYYASDGGILELHSRTRLPRDGSSPFVRAE